MAKSLNTRHLSSVAKHFSALLEKHYLEGFGIMPAGDKNENFHGQVWTRDFAHAASHYFIGEMPQAVEDSFSTLFRHQQESGRLPIRVEREYMLLQVVPGLRSFARPVFTFLEKNIRGRSERPVYHGQDFNMAEDTIPAALIAAGYFFETPRGRTYIESNFESLQRAFDHFAKKADADGLISITRGNVDWADSIVRGGKLGLVNVLWVQALAFMSEMLSALGKENAGSVQKHFLHARKSLLEKIYDKSGGYFKSTEKEHRLDTAASVLGALFFLSADECVRVEEALNTRVACSSGLLNFDPPYTSRSIKLAHRLIQHGGYHNRYAWPWLVCQNTNVKIKIADTHSDENVRTKYKEEAIEDLANMGDLFAAAGGAYEIFFPDDRTPAITRWYKPPKNFMANLASFVSVFRALQTRGWIS